MSETAGDPDPTTAASAQVPTYYPATATSNASVGGPYSTDTTGGNFTDLTWDDTPGSQPDQQHPDFHAVLTPNGQPFQFWTGTDGGVVRSDGQFDNASADCLKYHVNDPDTLIHCERVLSRVPHQLFDTQNLGLSTLQYQSVSLNPQRPQEDIQGGTQDNGSWDWDGQKMTWMEEMYGDGGQTGYNYGNPQIRFTEFFDWYTDENFQNGKPDKWVVTSGPLSQTHNHENVAFYMPQVTDYTNFGYQYTGEQHVWRTNDNGGDEAYLEANCPEFTTSGDDIRCGDWKPLGDPNYVQGSPTAGQPGDLTSAQYGADKITGFVAAVERNPGNNNELWAATSLGRVFVSLNVNDPNQANVQFCRLDNIAVDAGGNDVATPMRFVSSIYPDPANPNRAWISYDGYSSNTPDTPGHVFEVTFTGGSSTSCPTSAVWRDLHVEQGSTHQPPAGDIPIDDLVRDDYTGDLYAATDFGVLRGVTTDKGATYTWTQAGANLPYVEVAGLTIDPCSRLLYAATHGRSVWRMFLPKVSNAPSKACPRTP
jgi:hypothetical protein